MKVHLYAAVLLAGAMLIASCGKNEPKNPEPGPSTSGTVSVTLPDDGPLGVYRWCSDDKIRIGSTSLSLKEGDGEKKGVFEGTPQKDNYYLIAFPADITGADSYMSYSLAGQKQQGNGRKGHLLPTVLIEDVNTYEDITLSDAWVNSKGGSMRTNGIVEFALRLPHEAGTLTSITLEAAGVKFPVNNDGSVTADKLELQLSGIDASIPTIAYLSVSEKVVEIPAGSAKLTVTGATSYSIMLSQAIKMGGGLLTNINVADASSWSAYSALTGAGTEASPYILSSAEHLEQMGDLLQEGKTTWFELGADIDMSSVLRWMPLNISSPYDLGVHFDGKGHKISNFKCEAGSYPSFFGVLNGTVQNVTFEHATLDGSGKAGVVAGYAGTNLGDAATPKYISATISNVKVVSSTITADNYAGGIVGQIGAPGTFTDCSVKDITITSTAERVGGAFGQVGYSNPIIDVTVTRCTAENVTLEATKNVGGLIGVCYGKVTNSTASGHVTHTLAATSEVSVGGFVGHLENGSIADCSSSTQVELTINGRSVGGFVGVFKAGKIERCYSTGDVIGKHRNNGGFVGLIQTTAASATIENCYSTGNVSSANGYTGGFVGLVDGKPNTAIVNNCYCTGDVSGTFAIGGFVGVQGCSVFHLTNCAAWNKKVTPSAYAQTNWSSGAVIAVTHPNCFASANYRNPSMELTAYCPPPSADWDHPDINGTTTPLYQNSPTAPFTWAYSTATTYAAGTDNVDAGRWAYHGKHVAAGTTLSQLASTTLGWSASVWDFSGELPVLK